MAIPSIRPNGKREAVWRDIDFNFSKNPITNDVVAIVDVKAINNALRNLLLIDTGEYLFQPTKGAGIRSMLFDNLTPAVVQLIKELVKDTINTYEPRAQLDNVEVISTVNSNEILIRITYFALSEEEKITTTVLMERTR